MPPKRDKPRRSATTTPTVASAQTNSMAGARDSATAASQSIIQWKWTDLEGSPNSKVLNITNEDNREHTYKVRVNKPQWYGISKNSNGAIGPYETVQVEVTSTENSCNTDKWRVYFDFGKQEQMSITIPTYITNIKREAPTSTFDAIPEGEEDDEDEEDEEDEGDSAQGGGRKIRSLKKRRTKKRRTKKRRTKKRRTKKR